MKLSNFIIERRFSRKVERVLATSTAALSQAFENVTFRLPLSLLLLLLLLLVLLVLPLLLLLLALLVNVYVHETTTTLRRGKLRLWPKRPG